MHRRSTLKKVGTRPRENYAIIPNGLARDPSIKPRAKAVALYLWSLPDGWEFSVDSLAESTGMSNKTAGAAVHDLIEARWLRRDERKNRHGLVFEYVYVLSQGRRFAVKTTANMAVESTAPTKTEKTDDTRKASGVTDGLTAVVVQGPWGDPWGESAYG